MLRNASAMTAEREALRMGIEYLTVLFPTEVSSFDFQFESTGRTAQYQLNAQSLRLFGLHRDVNDAHRAGANRLRGGGGLAAGALRGVNSTIAGAQGSRIHNEFCSRFRVSAVVQHLSHSIIHPVQE